MQRIQRQVEICKIVVRNEDKYQKMLAQRRERRRASTQRKGNNA